MRVLLFLALVLTGCAGVQPRNPTWRNPTTPAAALVTEASAAVAATSPSWRPRWQQIGSSHQGRPLRITRLGRGPRRVVWIGGIHGNEREGRVSTEELPRALLTTPGAMEQITLTILEDVNPDGTAANQRGNSQGIDLNRNYPAKNFLPSESNGQRPLDQPEARALHEFLLEERPHLVIVAHSWHNDHFINFDGPAEHLAERFSKWSGYRVKASDKFAPTPGSLGSWVGRTLGIPILTLEYHRGREPHAAWRETRSAILSVVLQG